MPDRAVNRDVFINCPFDPDYLDILRAIVFAVRACGYRPRTAQDESDGSEVRIVRISRLIEQCDWGIHDLSAVALDPGTAMPRFNMPLELGLSMGAKRFGGKRQKLKRLLILDAEKHRYDRSTSDISGQDIESHQGRPEHVIRVVRNWLADNAAPGQAALPGGAALSGDYGAIRGHIEAIIVRERLDSWTELTHVDYLRCLDAALLLLADAGA